MDQRLLLLFDRPREPIFALKGEENVFFDVPKSYYADEYKDIAIDEFKNNQILSNRFGESKIPATIPVKQIAIPDLQPALTLGRRENFSLFLKSHQKCSTYLIKLFMEINTYDDLMSLAAYCRDRVNTQMYIYSLSIAILHRSDTKHLSLPNLCEILPDNFIDSAVFSRTREIASIFPDGQRPEIEIPMDWTASNADPEHLVAYWREDIGINLHHWHWHLIYPFAGPDVVVKKDRRGELVYYMHHQIMARYNIERLCNGLPRAKKLMNLREPIPEGYFPKMDQAISGHNWPGRPVNMVLSDVKRAADEVDIKISEMQGFMDRIIETIKTRKVINTNGTVTLLDEKTGIDVLGNIMEASVLSPNPVRYGDLHNMGHMVLAFIHDPDHRFLESFGTMGNTATAMRDPVFYRWHATVDYLFDLFKEQLPPYTHQELSFPGITVDEIKICTPGGNPNTLNCHWTKSNINLSSGLDFGPRGSAIVKVQHLDHQPFSYRFTISSANSQELTATVRVLIAPKFDEKGSQLQLNEQRLLMIEMDKFTEKLRRGKNYLNRNSNESSITIPFEATFPKIDQKENLLPIHLQNLEIFNFCGCGWPQHMLVPKGTRSGFPMDLFVMVTDYRLDKVEQPEATGCRTGVSFCGLRDRKYPDARPMGFPFDRVPRPHVDTIDAFLTPNMRVQPITIRFSNEVKQTRQSGKAADSLTV